MQIFNRYALLAFSIFSFLSLAQALENLSFYQHSSSCFVKQYKNNDFFIVPDPEKIFNKVALNLSEMKKNGGRITVDDI